MYLYCRRERSGKRREKGSRTLPLPAMTLILLTVVHGALICTLGSGGANPVSQDQRKQRRQRQHQQLHLRILHGTQSKSFDGESQVDGPYQSCGSGVCGLLHSDTRALIAMASRQLNVSSPVFWPWHQLACNELHPCYWTLQNRVAAAKLLIGNSASGGSQNLGFAWWGASRPGAKLC